MDDTTLVSETQPPVAANLKRKALGRGLAALLPETSSALNHDLAPVAGFRVLPLEKIYANPEQPRRYFDEEAIAELANSIANCGVLQPIIVRRDGNNYQIIAGERRFRAAKMAKLVEIPAIIKEYTPVAALKVALIENIQRQDLDPLEEASTYHALQQQHHLTHEVIAKAVGKSRTYITNSLRLLKLPQEILQLVQSGQLSSGHVRPLVGISPVAAAVALAHELVRKKCSVREAEERARVLEVKLGKKRSPQVASNGEIGMQVDTAKQSLETRLMHKLGTKVALHQQHGRGRLELYFQSLDDLDTLLEKLLR